MGIRQSKEINYAIPINNPDRKPNETFIYRNAETVNIDPKDFKLEFKTLHDVYNKTFGSNLDDS